jgi:prophage antirepressor-like protein
MKRAAKTRADEFAEIALEALARAQSVAAEEARRWYDKDVLPLIRRRAYSGERTATLSAETEEIADAAVELLRGEGFEIENRSRRHFDISW